MVGPVSEAERQIRQIQESESRILRLQNRIRRLKAGGRQIEQYESLLASLEEALVLRKERLSQLTAPVKYRCYLMSNNHIRSVRVLECADDAQVVVNATAVLEAHPEHDSAEIWNRQRIVARIPRAK